MFENKLITIQPKKFSYSSMGTSWEVSLWDDVSDKKLAELKKEIMSQSEEFDKTYSRFINSSLVWKIAECPGIYEVPKDFMKMLAIYMNLYKPSGEKLNPLIGFSISDMGYDRDYSLIAKSNIRKTPDLLETVKVIDDTHIEVNKKVLFDLGALGKGYFVDRIKDILKREGIQNFLVNGSGDIFYYGDGMIKAGLEHPRDPSKVIGVINMKTGAMCASGINRRVWNRYHHVIDPETNASTKGIVATWVMAETTALSDALASCLFLTLPEALSHFKFEYCIMNDFDMIKKSDGFSAEFF